jgi:hypothetical protein
MNAAQEYKIATIADILALSPDQRVRCVADMAGWVDMVNAAEKSGLARSEAILIWVDDELPPGTVSGAILNGVRFNL